jgi:hypothetical protein
LRLLAKIRNVPFCLSAIKEHAAEAEPLAQRLRTTRTFAKKGPQPLAEILAIVLARLGVGMLPSKPSEEKDLT